MHWSGPQINSPLFKLAFHCYDRRHDPNHHGKKMVYSTLQYVALHSGRPGQELKAGTKEESTEEKENKKGCFTGSLSIAWPACSFMQPRIAYSVAWTLLHQPLIKKIPPTDIFTGQFDGGNFSMESPSSKAVLVYIKMTKTNLHNVYPQRLMGITWDTSLSLLLTSSAKPSFFLPTPLCWVLVSMKGVFKPDLYGPQNFTPNCIS